MCPRVSVIIPTYDGQRWLPACLAALGAQTFTDFDVWLVDNRAGEATCAVDRGAYPFATHVIVNAENRHFAAAANQGLAASEAPLLAVLNDDTIPSPGWLRALVDAIAPPRTGAAASLLVFDAQPELVQSAGICLDRAAIGWDRLRGHPVAAAREPAPVFGASGGAALYRREMLEEIGPYCEDFEAYLEDVDLAWRAQRAGWQCRYAPDAVVRHVTSATAIEGSTYKLARLGRNKVWSVARNARRRDLPVIAFYDAAAVLYTLLRRGDTASLRARLVGLSAWSRHWRARRGGFPALAFDPLVAPWQVPARMRGPGGAP